MSQVSSGVEKKQAGNQFKDITVAGNKILYLYDVNFKSMTNPAALIFLRYGGAKKSSFEMTQEELEQAAASILQRAKEKAFSKGLPIYFSKGDKVFAEYPDGHIAELNKRA